MISTFEKHLVDLANTLHARIFGTVMGEEMKKFIKNLGWMSIGATLGGVFLFVTNLAAGRLLGPEEYGKYSIIISMGQFLIIPMLLGLNTSAMRYIARHKDECMEVISNSLVLVVTLIIISVPIFFALKNWIKSLFNIDDAIFIFAILYAIILALKYLSEAIMKGMHEFKLLSKLNIISAILIFVSFFSIILLTKNHTFRSYAIATALGFAIFFLVLIAKHGIIFSKIKLTMAGNLMNYGLFASLGSISGFILNNIDRIILNNYLGFSAVGLFAAYISASSFFSGQLLQIFIDVFFPSISAVEDKRIIYHKIVKIFYISVPTLFILNTIATSIIIKLYGDRYEFNIAYILLFSLLGAITFCQNTLWWFIASFGNRGVRFTSTSGIVIGIFNIFAMMVLIKLFGLIGAIFGLIIAALIMIFISIIYLKRKNGTFN
jgi:O-antigen/teichoic acid export membrane protein